MCKYINVKTVGCRNTIENKVCSALLTTTSLSYCLYFSDSTLNALYHPHMSVTYLSHPCFYQKLFLFLSAPAKIFVIVGTDLFFPVILHRSVCKGKACFTLTTWLGHQWVWAPFWLLSGYVFFIYIYINISVSELVPRWQIADRGRQLISCFCAMSIYGVKYITWQWCTLISDRWITNICVTFTFWFSKS